MTRIQFEVALAVLAAYKRGDWYRAAGSGQRVTLASLNRAHILDRRAWRGVEGQANAAYEYRPSRELLAEVAREAGTSVPMAPYSSDVQAVARKAGPLHKLRGRS